MCNSGCNNLNLNDRRHKQRFGDGRRTSSGCLSARLYRSLRTERKKERNSPSLNKFLVTTSSEEGVLLSMCLINNRGFRFGFSSECVASSFYVALCRTNPVINHWRSQTPTETEKQQKIPGFAPFVVPSSIHSAGRLNRRSTSRVTKSKG